MVSTHDTGGHNLIVDEVKGFHAHDILVPLYYKLPKGWNINVDDLIVSSTPTGTGHHLEIF